MKAGAILCPLNGEIISGNALSLKYFFQSPGHSEEGHYWLRALSGEVEFGLFLVKQLCHCVKRLTLESSRALAVAVFLHEGEKEQRSWSPLLLVDIPQICSHSWIEPGSGAGLPKLDVFHNHSLVPCLHIIVHHLVLSDGPYPPFWQATSIALLFL